MRAAIYARVSTSNHGQDSKLRLREIAEYCERRGWTVTGEYVDIGISGAKEKRPQLDRLVADARRRRFDAVVVYRYDRFARSLRHLVNALEEFRSLGIEFVSIHEGVDTSTPNGRLTFGIFASIAEFERELIRDRVKAGLRNARAKGERLDRPKVVLDASKIAALRSRGLGWKKISKELGVGVGTARRIAQEASEGGSKNPTRRTFRTPKRFAKATITRGAAPPSDRRERHPTREPSTSPAPPLAESAPWQQT